MMMVVLLMVMMTMMVVQVVMVMMMMMIWQSGDLVSWQVWGECGGAALAVQRRPSKGT